MNYDNKLLFNFYVEIACDLDVRCIKDYWLYDQAPRRQCCEVINGVDGPMSDFVRVKIRGCNGWESVTPP